MTSATFLFLGEHPAPAATTLYLFFDGDPEGAAQALRAMLRADRGSSATAFIRANAEAQLVCGHDVWPNTSYRYTLSETSFVVEQRRVLFEEGWDVVYDGPLREFLNARPGEYLHALALYGDRVGYYTVSQLLELEREAQNQVTKLAGQPTWEPARRHLAELRAILAEAYRVEEFGEMVA